MDTGPVLPFSPYPEIQFQDATVCDAGIALEMKIVAFKKQIQSPKPSVHDLNTYLWRKEGRKER